MKKDMNEVFPSIDAIRPITVTSFHQKLLERALKQLFEKWEKKLFQGQLGFI